MKNNKKYFKLISLIVIFLLIVSGCSDQNSSTGENKPVKVIKWRMVTHQMPGTSRYENTIIPFVKAVEEASNGRLIIEPYGAGVLFPVSESLDSVKNGLVEMSASWDGLWAGKDPVFALAGNIPTDPIRSYSEHFFRAEKMEPIISKAYEGYGVKYLGAFDFGPLEILMSSKQIKNLGDFKGINIRAAGMAGDFYSQLGASVVSMSSQEIYTALQLGTVDAAEYNDWIVNMEMGFDEVTKYVIEPVLHTGALTDKSLIVNQAAWEKLDDDLKQIVIQCMNVARYRSAIDYEVGSNISKKDFLSKGSSIIELSEEEIKEAKKVAAGLIASYKDKNELCKEFVDEYAKVLKELGYHEEAKNLGY